MHTYSALSVMLKLRAWLEVISRRTYDNSLHDYTFSLYLTIVNSSSTRKVFKMHCLTKLFSVIANLTVNASCISEMPYHREFLSKNVAWNDINEETRDNEKQYQCLTNIWRKRNKLLHLCRSFSYTLVSHPTGVHLIPPTSPPLKSPTTHRLEISFN
jgi:hypothetical protein